MIVFTIAYGAPYIDKLCNLCLPSLLMPGNLPSVKNEPLELCILTYTSDLPYLKFRMGALEEGGLLRNTFGKVYVSVPGDEVEKTEDQGPNWRNTYFLIQAINLCLEKNQPFLHALPDLIYSNGIVNTCWNIHRLTRKTVAVFNGRVEPHEGQPFFSNESLLKTTQTPGGVLEFFLENMSSDWRDNSTTDPDNIPGDHQGTLGYAMDGQQHFFASSPNPFIGRFTLDDLFYFAGGNGFRCWDHEWLDHLLRMYRLYVQTNLDFGMTIEPERESKLKKVMDAIKAEGGTPNTLYRMYTSAYAPDALESYRHRKFCTDFSHFSFTTSRLPKTEPL